MKTYLVKLSMFAIVVILIAVSVLSFQQGWFSGRTHHTVDTINPELEGGEENIVNMGMPVPGLEGIDEMIVE